MSGFFFKKAKARVRAVFWCIICIIEISYICLTITNDFCVSLLHQLISLLVSKELVSITISISLLVSKDFCISLPHQLILLLVSKELVSITTSMPHARPPKFLSWGFFLFLRLHYKIT